MSSRTVFSSLFIAALQVIVYAGAILVLFLFVIMLLNLQQEAADVRPLAVMSALENAGQ